MAKLISPNGDVSPLCADVPRVLDLRKESWTLRNEAVTCQKCKAKLAQAKGAGIKETLARMPVIDDPVISEATG